MKEKCLRKSAQCIESQLNIYLKSLKSKSISHNSSRLLSFEYGFVEYGFALHGFSILSHPLRWESRTEEEEEEERGH